MKDKRTQLRKLRQTQLDSRYKHIFTVANDLSSISGSWIKEIRNALGISPTQFAKLLGISRPSFLRLETNEGRQTIELQTLRRIASAINCQVIYALVPEPNYGSLESILKERARATARKIIDRVAKTMALESQSVQAQELDRQIQELADDLVRNLDKRLWD